MQKQRQTLKLKQSLSPQQIIGIKLLEIPVMELDQRIREEIEENPVLEEGLEKPETEEEEPAEKDNSDDEFDLEDYLNSDDDIPDYKLYTARDPNREDKEMPMAVINSFKDELEHNLFVNNRLTETQTKIASYIIGNLDDDGYLRRDLESVTDDLAFKEGLSVSEEEVETVLAMIQSLDPAGLGARNLKECLLLQLDRMDNDDHPALPLARKILTDWFDEFSKRHYEKILSKESCTKDELKDALELIQSLNPKPGNNINELQNKNYQVIIPDFITKVDDNQNIIVSLNNRSMPELKISKTYKNMLQGFSEKKKLTKEDKKNLQYIKQKIDSAHWFIDALNQRNNTLLKTMQAIVEYQHEFFLTEDTKLLKPMILKDIAEMTGFDISTISRVANSKYVQTPRKIYLLKDFFSEKMTDSDGEDISTRKIKETLKEIISDEDKQHPYSDEYLAKVLKNKGFPIARRTVAKYREQLNIPIARLRKEL
jgi:RNA polymerase sigma-54 factor